MIYRNLPNTNTEVSALSLGTVFYDGVTFDEKSAAKQIEFYLENGGNLIDTAHLYGYLFPENPSMSEKIIGKYFKSSGNRDKVFLVTKGAHPRTEAMHISRLSEKEILQDISESLEFLNTNHIDLYFLHRDDKNIPIGEIVERMDNFVKKKLISAWGFSNFETSRMKEAIAYAKKHNLAVPYANQTLYSYATIRKEAIEDKTLVPIDRQMYDFHKEENFFLMAYTSQAKGYFPRKLLNQTISEDYIKVFDIPENHEKLELLKKVSSESGLSISTLSLLYFMVQPFTAIPIVSYSKKHHFEEALKGFDEENIEIAKKLITKYDFI